MRVSDYMSVLTVKPLVANQPDQPGIEFSLTGNLVCTSYENFGTPHRQIFALWTSSHLRI